MVSEKASLAEKVLILSCMVFLGVYGTIKLILGLVYIDGCSDIRLLPVYFVLGGVFSLVPPLLMVYRNVYRKDSPENLVNSLWWILEKLFLLSLVIIFAGTIYTLVCVTQTRVIGRLCSQHWLPPFGIAVLCIDWVCYVTFFRSLCNVEYKDPPPEPQFSLPLYWSHRHRVLRQ